MNIRRALVLLGLLGLGYLLASNLGGVNTFWDALRQMRWYLIPLLIVTQIASYWTNAGFYRAFFRMTERSVDYRKLYEVSLAINFATTVIPAGTVAGTTFLASAVHDEVPPGQATLSQIARYIFTFMSYFVVMATGFIWLFFGGNIGRISVRFTIFVMLGVLVGFIILILVFSERRRLEATLHPVIYGVNKLGRTIMRRPVNRPLVSVNRLSTFLDEFYEAYEELSHHRRYRLQLFWWTLGCNIFEVMSVYAVFIGFGHWVNPGIVIAGYTFAIIASSVGFLTNGIGIYEAGMIGTFTALGEPFGLAFTVVIVYRALSMILFLPPGFVYYRKYIKLVVPTKATA